MASVVSIQVKVDSGPSVAELDRIANGMSGVTEKTLELDRAADLTGIKLKKALDPAPVDKMTGHVSTGLDSVRLLSQEFGLRLPRAIEAMLSRMPNVTNALTGILGAMAGIVALQVFVHLAEEAHRLYEEYFSLNAVQQKYLDGLEKARLADVGNTHSIETTRQRLALETQVASQLKSQADETERAAKQQSGNILGFGIPNPKAIIETGFGAYRAHDLAKQAADAATQRDALARKLQVDDTHAAALAQIELNHASDGELVGRQKVNAELQKKLQMNAEERRNNVAQERQFGNVTNPNSGAAEQAVKDAQARQEAAAENVLLYRKERDERIAAQNSAIDAGLQGEARYRAEVEQSIAAITQKFHDGEISKQTFLSETASAQLKADNERLIRLQKLQDESRQMHRQTSLDGLDPGARIGAEERNAVADINTKETNYSGGAPLTDDERTAFASERADAHTAAIQKMTALEDSFSEHVKSLEDSRLEASLSGFDKIAAGAQKQIDDLQRMYDKDFKDAQLTDDQKKQSAANLQGGITAITGAAAQQRTELTARNNEEDLQYAQQAAEAEKRVRANGIMGWVSSYKDGITEIQAQEQARLAKLQEDVSKQGLTQQEASQRKMDIEREANANIAEQNQQLQEKIAGDLQQAFTNPVDFIKSQMEKMMFEIIAGWIVRMNVFKGLFGTTMGNLAPGAPTGATGAGGFAGTLAGAIPGMRGIVNGSPNISSIYSNAAPSTVSSGGGFGASSGTASQASAISAAPSGLAAPRIGVGSAGGFGGILGDVNSATGTLSQAIPGMRGIVNGSVSSSAGGSASDPYTAGISDAQAQAAINTGTIAPNAASNTLQQGLGIAGVVGTAGYSAEQTTVKAFETGNPLQGALGDAGAGAAIGTAIMPGLGTAIGAGIGAAVGASAGLIGLVSGEAGNLGARDYYEKTILPSLNSASLNPGGDYQSAVSNIGKIASDGMAYMTTKFGASAARWVNSNYLTKETDLLLQKVEDTAAGGRQYVTMSAGQFHTGGTIAGFGDLATSSNEGFIHAMLNETVMNPAASMTHAPALAAINSGASHSDIASMYLAGAKPSSSSSPQSGGDTHHWSVNALDAKSFESFLKNGGARTIVKHTNTYSSQYAGDGISG